MRHDFRVEYFCRGVAQLLLQFLVLVMPTREFVCREVQCPAETSTYLWHDGHRIRRGAHVRRTSERTSGQALGVAIGPRSWRQIAVGIAIKTFSGLHQGDLDPRRDPNDDMGGQSILEFWGGAMADVLHRQAARSVVTDNSAYGGTVNFDHGFDQRCLARLFSRELALSSALPNRLFIVSGINSAELATLNRLMSAFRADLCHTPGVATLKTSVTANLGRDTVRRSVNTQIWPSHLHRLSSINVTAGIEISVRYLARPAQCGGKLAGLVWAGMQEPEPPRLLALETGYWHGWSKS